VAFGIASLVGFSVAKPVFQILQQPLIRVLPSQSVFISTHALETWMVYFKVGLWVGAFLCLPIWTFHLWRFVAPGLFPREKKWVVPLSVSLALLFMMGALFGYFVVFPIGFDYLIVLVSDASIQFLPSVDSYLSLVVNLMLAFGLVFELPVLIFVLAYTEIVSMKKFMSFQRYVVLLALIVGGILTPPDPITQILMAVPLMIFYELGLGLAWVMLKFKKRPALTSALSSNHRTS
jgi:sec-independent protein translocase protein TatC